MNNCTISGHIVRNATLRGSDPKVLSFVVDARHSSNDQGKRDPHALIPCVIFNPRDALVESLTKEGAGLNVEFEGRLTSSSYETRNETRHTCEVVVRPWTLFSHPAFATAN